MPKKAKRQARKEKRKGFFKEFGAFINKGNVLQLAIGVVIGTAFSAITSSLVNDVIMPLFGLITQSNLAEAQWVLVAATEERAATVLRYGAFIQAIIDFLIIAFSIFIAIRAMGKVGKLIDKHKAELLNRIQDLKAELESKFDLDNAEDKAKAEALKKEIAELEDEAHIPHADEPQEAPAEVHAEPGVADAASVVVVPAATPAQNGEVEKLLAEIRDLLAKTPSTEV